MADTYKKLTRHDLNLLGFSLPDDKYKPHRDFVAKYYPPTAYTLVLVLNSEYNDNTYDNSIQYLVVYDRDGNEIPPLKATAKNCRGSWDELPIPGTGPICGYSDCESNEQLDEIVVKLSIELPELYIKVSK